MLMAHRLDNAGHESADEPPVLAHLAEVAPIAAVSESAAPRASAITARKASRIDPRMLVTWLLSAVSLVVLIAAWHFAVKYKLDFYIRFNNIPSPEAVFDDAASLFGNARFQRHVGLSLRRILTGFSIAAIFAIPLGLLLGRNRVARELVFPALEILRPIPAIAWVPMSIMLWPSNEVSIVFITFLGSFFPILLNTIQGVQSLDKVLVRAARSLGAGQLALFWHVVLPGSLPQVFTGLTIGMGVAWVSLIAAEMISGQFGIGYFTWEAYSLVRYSEIVLGMIVIGVLGLACSGVIRLIGGWLMPWAARQNQESN
jgi:NitT/TauT family transport system permease protein